ncbi:MAG: hypothetical protein AB7L09_02580 [Nitrospira sp.]
MNGEENELLGWFRRLDPSVQKAAFWALAFAAAIACVSASMCVVLDSKYRYDYRKNDPFWKKEK